MNNQTERIQNAINHIKTATDVDPWAVEIAVEAMDMAIEALKAQELKNVPDTNVGGMISRQAAIDALEKCYTCKHVYQRASDADTLYCRCRKGCRYEEVKPKRSGESPRRHEG